MKESELELCLGQAGLLESSRTESLYQEDKSIDSIRTDRRRSEMNDGQMDTVSVSSDSKFKISFQTWLSSQHSTGELIRKA